MRISNAMFAEDNKACKRMPLDFPGEYQCEPVKDMSVGRGCIGCRNRLCETQGETYGEMV